MAFFVTEIENQNDTLVFTYNNTLQKVLQGPFVLAQKGIVQTKGNIINNFYLITGREEITIRFGKEVVQVGGVPFSGTFEELGVEVFNLIREINSSGGGINPFGESFSYIEDDTESSTNSSNYQIKLLFSSPILESGKSFILQYTCESYMSNTSGRVGVQVLGDGVLLAEHIQESKDSRNRNGFSGFKIINGAGVAQSFQIRFNNDGNGTATIRRARLMIFRVL